MYSVIAPAASCDEEQGHRTDDATQENNKNDLKLVSFPEGSVDTGEDIQPVDPSEIAAKILQMHASADEVKATGSREPKLVWGHEDTSFEIPGVLRRPRENDPYVALQPEPVPEPARSDRKSGSVPMGPRSMALVCCALLAVAAGGVAVIFGMPGPTGQEAATSRTVETEVIAPEPAAVSAATAAEQSAGSTSSTVATQAEQQTASNVTAATPQQIAKAKDRIRTAFATGSTSAPATSGQPARVAEQPVNVLANQAQLRLEQTDKTVEPQAVAGASGNLPVIASTAETVPIPDNLIPAPSRVQAPITSDQDPVGSTTEPVISTAEPVVNASEPATGLQTPQAETTPLPASEATQPLETAAALPSDPSYPNTATTTASVNMRQSEEKDATIIAVIPQDTQVQFNECGKWWCGVVYEGKSGFVGEKYLVRSSQPE